MKTFFYLCAFCVSLSVEAAPPQQNGIAQRLQVYDNIALGRILAPGDAEQRRAEVVSTSMSTIVRMANVEVRVDHLIVGGQRAFQPIRRVLFHPSENNDILHFETLNRTSSLAQALGHSLVMPHHDDESDRESWVSDDSFEDDQEDYVDPEADMAHRLPVDFEQIAGRPRSFWDDLQDTYDIWSHNYRVLREVGYDALGFCIYTLIHAVNADWSQRFLANSRWLAFNL